MSWDSIALLQVTHTTVIPEILGHHVFRPTHITLFAVVDKITVLVIFYYRLTRFSKFTGSTPIPPHLGKNTTPGIAGNMTTLTGHFIGVVI